MIGHENPNNTRELTRIIRPVRRAVVDHDDFAIVPGLRRVLEDAHESGPEAFLLVVRGDDDADVQVGRPPAKTGQLRSVPAIQPNEPRDGTGWRFPDPKGYYKAIRPVLIMNSQPDQERNSLKLEIIFIFS